jgi:hypothetical protein
MPREDARARTRPTGQRARDAGWASTGEARRSRCSGRHGDRKLTSATRYVRTMGARPALTRRERLLYHQLHPLKLATDLASAVGAIPLFWRHRLGLALLVSLVPPVVVSAALLRWGSFERQRDSAFGRYVARWMSPAVEAARLSGFAVSAVGAWLHAPAAIVAGAAVVLAAWLRGVGR